MGAAAAPLMIASVGMNLLSAQMESESAAQEAKLSSKIAKIQGKQDVVSIQENLLKQLANNIAATAASGITMAGTPSEIQETNIRTGRRAIEASESQTALEKEAIRYQKRRTQTAAWTQAISKSLGTASSYAIQSGNLGSVNTGTGTGTASNVVERVNLKYLKRL